MFADACRCTRCRLAAVALLLVPAFPAAGQNRPDLETAIRRVWTDSETAHPADARSYVEALADDAVAVWTDESLSYEERERRFRALIEERLSGGVDAFDRRPAETDAGRPAERTMTEAIREVWERRLAESVAERAEEARPEPAPRVEPAIALREGLDDATDAESFIRALSERAIAIWRDPGLEPRLRRARFRELLEQGFAVDLIARLVLGRHAAHATPEHLSRYRRAFPRYIVESFAQRLGDYGDERIEIRDSHPVGSRDSMVRTRIRRPEAGPVTADWRVRRDGDAFRVVDVKIEGISLVITRRAEFSAILGRGGFPALLAVLEGAGAVETAAARAGPAPRAR